MKKFTPKLAFILSIILLNAILPFGFYFLLCISATNIPQLRDWWVKAGLVFGTATTAEILQFLAWMHWA